MPVTKFVVLVYAVMMVSMCIAKGRKANRTGGGQSGFEEISSLHDLCEFRLSLAWL